ncbi:hypothetical protein HK096_000412 [Nowakowskiella sp. JEL0078]|nr:hypothetical protein HK096_000412 [Nowakowskiella sp. JEL0078]
MENFWPQRFQLLPIPLKAPEQITSLNKLPIVEFSASPSSLTISQDRNSLEQLRVHFSVCSGQIGQVALLKPIFPAGISSPLQGIISFVIQPNRFIGAVFTTNQSLDSFIGKLMQASTNSQTQQNIFSQGNVMGVPINHQPRPITPQNFMNSTFNIPNIQLNNQLQGLGGNLNAQMFSQISPQQVQQMSFLRLLQQQQQQQLNNNNNK